MTGFETRPFINTTPDSPFVPLLGDQARELGKADFEARIGRAKDKRAAHIRAFALRLVATWASVWRRPGSMIPKALRAGIGIDRLVGPA